MDKVFMVQLDWSTEDDHGVHTVLFEDENDAQKYFNDTVADEKANTWIDSDAVIEADNESCFSAYLKGYGDMTYTYISIMPMEIRKRGETSKRGAK